MNDKLRRLVSSSGLAQGGLAFFVATAMANLSNFVFHVIVSRLLGPSTYGALGALLNTLLVLSVPLAALQAVVTKAESAHLHSEGHGIGLRTALYRAVLAGAVGTGMLVVLSPLVDSYLHFQSSVPMILLAIWVLPAVVGAVLQGVLMGRLRFSVVAVATVVGGIFGRLALGVLLIELGFGLDGAVLASVISQLILTGILLVPLMPEVIHSKVKELGIGFRSGVHSILALGGYWVLASEDTVLARHFLPAKEAGLYASASTAGRIALFLPGAIGMLAFPRFARDKGAGHLSRSTIRWSFPATALLGLISAVVLLAVPSIVIEVLFGSSYLGAQNAVRILGVEAAGLGILALLIYLHLARDSLASLYAWLGATIAFVGIELFHSSTVSLALVMLVSVGVATGVSLVAAINALLINPLIEDVDFVEKHLFSATTEIESGVDLSIVVPYYNPGAALSKHVAGLVEVLEASGMRFEIIAVSDGSTDGSPDTLTNLFPDLLKNTKLPKNSGKGQALRVGLMQGRGKYLGFIDADGDIPAIELLGIIEVIRASDLDIITGSKRHPSSVVYYPKLRRVYSWGYQQLIRTLFHLSVTDTQTGLKVLKRDVVRQVLPLMVEKRFAFDLEFFVVARRLGYREIVEVPVVIQRRFTSTISIKAVRGMLVDTLGIFYRMNVLRYYDRVLGENGKEQVADSKVDCAAIADAPQLPMA